MATNGDITIPEQYPATTAADAAAEQTTTTGGSNQDLPKDEVGWYFVEQYYTTLSKNPEKLHLFYGKRSQFVYGMEAEVANVSVGRQAIQERIKALDLKQCKVRITNVDSLPSFDNIVIQVIGETSNKGSEEPKKFCQTFVLAKQPSGYFVLNDIWRFMNDEEDEEQAEEPPKEAAVNQPEEAPAASADDDEPTGVPDKPNDETPAEPITTLDADVVDKKLEEVDKADKEETEDPDEADETPAEPAKEEPATVEKPVESEADPEAAARTIEEEDVKEPEKPKDPTPTPVAPAPATPPAETEKPAPAPKPMTWASRVAAAGPKPVVPLPKSATPSAAAPAKSTVPTSKPAPATQRPDPTQAADKENANPSQPSAGEWQTAGADSKRQRPQSMIQAAEKEGTLGYVKYVTEKVQEADLRAALSAFGPLTYFDINRPKNCAFVEFATPEGYKAAVAANPHVVNGENIMVEQRRPKSTAYGGTQYVANRGGTSGRGRGGFDGARSGSQGGTRGQYGGAQSRGRGGGAPRPSAKSTVQSS